MRKIKNKKESDADILNEIEKRARKGKATDREDKRK